jgi:hypothetical protein
VVAARLSRNCELRAHESGAELRNELFHRVIVITEALPQFPIQPRFGTAPVNVV